MLQLIRDRVKGWVAVLIFTLMIIPFAFWGINYYFEQSGGVIAMTVNGADITLTDYQLAYQNKRQQWRSMTDTPARGETLELLKQQTTDELALDEVLRQTALKNGLRIGEGELARHIRQAPIFNGENGFDASLFVLAANQLGLTPNALKAKIEQELLISQVRQGLLETGFVTPAEIAGYAGISRQTRDLRYAILASDPIKDSIEITPEQIDAYYDDPTRFTVPEQIRVAYLVLSRARVAEDVYLEEGALQAYFEANKQNYEVAETRSVQQILVRLPEDVSAVQSEALQARAQELYERVKDAEDFSEAALARADEYGDSVEYSEFAALSRGVLDEAVEDVVFTLEEGGISPPTQSGTGLHIVRVDAINERVETSLAEARAEVEADLRADQAAERMYELTDTLATLAYENPDTLEVAAEALGLEVQYSDWFSEDAPGGGIIAEPEALSAAFSEEVRVMENNSDLLELADERYMVLRLLERQPASRKPLAKVQDEIITRLKYDQARAQARELGEQILQQLDAGQSQEELALQYSLDWKTASGITRDDTGVGRAVLRAAFKAGIPEPGQPVFNGASLGTGDYAVVIVTALASAGEESIPEEALETARDELLRSSNESIWQAYTSGLQAKADITVYEDAL